MNKNQTSIFKWVVLTAVLILTFIGIIYASRDEATVDSSGLKTEEWVMGNEESNIVLIEYSDFQCPACRSRLSILEPLLEEFDNHIKFVYRHFPLRSIHQNAQLSAQASEAAGLQGKFWEMHAIIFENQAVWSELPNSEAKLTFIKYAEEIGLDKAKFESDLVSGEVEDLVEEDYQAGISARVGGTPTFFLNGQEVGINDYEQARQTIRQAIEAAK